MKLRMSRQWTRLSIPCEGRKIVAYRRADLTLEDGGDFVSSHLKSVVEDGGLLFQREKEPTGVREIRYPAGAVGCREVEPACGHDQHVQAGQ